MKSVERILAYQVAIAQELKCHRARTLTELLDSLCPTRHENFSHALEDLLSNGHVIQGEDKMFFLAT